MSQNVRTSLLRGVLLIETGGSQRPVYEFVLAWKDVFCCVKMQKIQSIILHWFVTFL